MININSDIEELRGAAYDLMGAICSYLDYDKNPIIASKGKLKLTVSVSCFGFDTSSAGIIPGDLSTFVTSLSDRLAGFAPQLTLDFLTVISTGMDKAGIAQRINCLQYMSPWVKNLAHFCNPSNPLYEHSGARLGDCIRTLIDLTIADLEVCAYPYVLILDGLGTYD